MSVAEQTRVAERRAPPRPPKRNGRWSGYLHLLMARMLELKREPEVVFWVFVFPLLLASGLGIAFRNKPADASSVAIASGAERAQALLQGSPQHAAFKIDVQDEASARKGFRLGKYDVVIEPDSAGGRAGPVAGGRCVADRGGAQGCGHNHGGDFVRAGIALHRLSDTRIAGD